MKLGDGLFTPYDQYPTVDSTTLAANTAGSESIGNDLGPDCDGFIVTDATTSSATTTAGRVR